MRTIDTRRLALLTAGVGAMAPLLLLTQPPAPLRIAVGVAVLLLAPGCAALCWLRPPDLAGATVITVAVGTAVMFIVPSALLYARVWSWPLCVAVTGGLTVLGCLVHLLRVRST